MLHLCFIQTFVVVFICSVILWKSGDSNCDVAEMVMEGFQRTKFHPRKSKIKGSLRARGIGEILRNDMFAYS